MHIDLDRIHYDETFERHDLEGPDRTTAITYQLNQGTHLYHVFEFYLPEALWALGAMQRLLDTVKQICPGSTVFHNASGQWNDCSEAVRVLRLSVEITDSAKSSVWDPDNLRQGLRGMCVELIVQLQAQDGHKEEAIFFNDWPAAGTLVRRLT